MLVCARVRALYRRGLSAQEYCRAMNDNEVPVIRSAWDRVAEQQCEDAVETAVLLYRDRMQSFLRGDVVASAASASGASAAGDSGRDRGPRWRWRAGVATATGALVFDVEGVQTMHTAAAAAARLHFVRNSVAVSALHYKHVKPHTCPLTRL
jgi:hypothetical protein